MPEIVDDAVEEGQDNLKPGLIGAAGFGVGSAVLGPGIGLPAGGVVAGSYIGGTEGTVLTITGMAIGLANLVFGPLFAGGPTAMGGSGGGQAQGVK